MPSNVGIKEVFYHWKQGLFYVVECTKFFLLVIGATRPEKRSCDIPFLSKGNKPTTTRMHRLHYYDTKLAEYRQSIPLTGSHSISTVQREHLRTSEL